MLQVVDSVHGAGVLEAEQVLQVFTGAKIGKAVLDRWSDLVAQARVEFVAR